ncbi:MAG: YfhO family protein [Bacteroidales bacterium]|nr:YfhO family protein [Bacteroidales bacterium]
MDKISLWIKRPQVWGFFLSVAVMALIAIAFFYPDNFEGNSLMQADMQQGAANGREAQEYEAATGVKALWTNSLMSGMPTFQISPSYPSNSLFTWLNRVYGLWLPSPSNLLFMMMLGFLILLYCMGMRWWIALAGAIAWGLSSYFVIIIGAGHIWKFVTLAYIPPTIGGLVLCYRGRYFLGGGLAALFAMLQLNANHPQMTYYFGFVIAGLVLAYLAEAIKEKKVARWGIATAVLVGAAVLAVGANLPSLYNTYEYSKETKRSQSELTPLVNPNSQAAPERPTGGLPRAEIVNWSYGRSEMMSLLVPNIKGGATAKPEKGQMVHLGLDQVEGAEDAPYDVKPLLPFFSQYFNDSEGTNGPVYVGALICALFLLGCILVKGPMKWALLILTLLSILLSLGRNMSGLTDFMIYNFPMYSKFRAVESILVVAEFTMPLLAMLALAQLLSWPSRIAEANRMHVRGIYMRALCISFGVCAALCLLGVAAPSIFGPAITSQDQSTMAQILNQYPQAGIDAQKAYSVFTELRYGMLRDDCWRSLIFLAIGFGVLWLYLNKRFAPAAAACSIGVLVLIDLYGVDKRYVDHESFAVQSFARPVNPHAPDAIDQAILQDQDPDYRVMDIPGFGSAARSYHHKMVGGYHAAKLNRYEDLIQRRMSHVLGIGYIPQFREDSIVAQYDPEDQAIIRELQADYRVLDMLNTRYIITGEKEAPLLVNPDALGNAWLVERVEYVNSADQEMEKLSTLNPAREAVADSKFQETLGVWAQPIANGDTISLTSYTPNELKYDVDTRDGGVAVFSEVYFPWGWKASIDGQPAKLGRVNYVLRAMAVPAGQHEITMVFDPDSLHTTSTVAYACVTLIYLWVIGGVLAAFLRREEEENVA